MPRKKNKIPKLLQTTRVKTFVLAWVFVMALLASYRLGVHRGKTLALHPDLINDPKRALPKVEKLTFFDTLHQPLHLQSVEKAISKAPGSSDVLPRMAAPPMVKKDEARKVEKKVVFIKKEPKLVVDTPKVKNLPAETPEAVTIEKPQPIEQKKLTISQRKKLPWAVQVGAFQDGMKAVLLRKELEKKGFGAYTITVRHNDLEIYRVLVAASSQAGSEKINADLQKDGYSASFVMKR